MEERQEMEWDNSALNITVNPLDHEVLLRHTNFAAIFTPSLRYFQSLTITATLHRLDMFTNDNNELALQ